VKIRNVTAILLAPLIETTAAVREFLRMLFRSSLPRVLLMLLAGIALAAAAISFTEGRTKEVFSSFWVSAWWAVVSMTSTGYGDIVPLTPVGRVIGSLVILSGVVLVSFFTATVSSLFVAAKIREGQGLEQIHYRDHTVICGYGFLTIKLLDSLKALSQNAKIRAVLIGDIPESDVADLMSRYALLDLKYVRGD